jgi:wobble nucleotide-excising tRNase
MRNKKRSAPYTKKGRRGGKKDDAIEELDERIIELEMQQAGVDTENLKNRMELMTAEQLSETQQIAAQNALKLFNDMLGEVKKRLPTMKDEVIVTTLLSIWDKTGGKK